MSDSKNLTNNQRFKRILRLKNSEEYQAVFQQSKKLSARNIALLVRPTDKSHPRLGLAVAKGSVKRAVDRNRVKRILREGFRRHQTHLSACDIVAISYKGLGKLNKSELRTCLEPLWKRLYK